MQWGPDVDAKLFMYVLKIHNVKLDYQALAIAMGNDVTPKAITHRIAKLRQIADEHFFPTASASPGIGLPGPRHRGPNKRPRGGANTATTAAAAATAASSPSIATTKSSLGTEGNARTPLGAGAGTKRKAGSVVAGEFGTAESAESAFREFVELGGKGGGDCGGDGEGEGMRKKGRGDVGGGEGGDGDGDGEYA